MRGEEKASLKAERAVAADVALYMNYVDYLVVVAVVVDYYKYYELKLTDNHYTCKLPNCYHLNLKIDTILNQMY